MRLSVFTAFAAAASLAAPAVAQPKAAPPRLIIAISVDQLSADLFDTYRPHFTGGFKRLVDQGVTFVNGYQSHAETETCPGHSTLLTGHHPGVTGVIANNWINQGAPRADKKVYCAEDEAAPGSTFQNYQVSPVHLKVPTLGELLKARDPRSRNVAVAGKDRTAVMMSGARVDQRWYWNGKDWVSDLKDAPVPATLPRFRAAFAAQFAQARPPLVPPPLCQARATPYQLTPTLTVGNGTLGRAAGDEEGMRTSPEHDGAVLALAAGLASELNLGRGPAPDVLAVGLSATDRVGHSYGWGGQEMCLHLLALDRELGDFLSVMDRRGVPYAVVLSADHGAADLPERLRAQGDTRAQRADPALGADAMGKVIAADLGLSRPALLGDGIGGAVWLDREIEPSRRPAVLAAALARYRAHPQVETVITAEESARLPMPTGDSSRWTLAQRVRAGFDPQRSGDFYLVLKAGVATKTRPTKGGVASHGLPWDYDRRVPILFVAPGHKPASPTAAADTVDILPTVASWIGLKLAPGSVDGVCRSEAATCR
ncbi:alkaline phosphatase family protein [Sphingomonas humi]|uniref:Alkaline phosphatase n=1 Tax=Sphingomonas humi TaxID=335630 RepID=A0ABP7S760_9SPHN